MIKALILGSNGKIGNQFKNTKNIIFIKLSRIKCNITDIQNVKKNIYKFKPNFIINCAAYTNVDKAESDIFKCYSVNVQGVCNIINAIKNSKIKFIHISSDFVFNGKKKGYYYEKDLPDPLNVYGRSKLFAEEIIKKSDANKRTVILRTSWVYSSSSKFFVGKILSNILKEKELKVPNNHYGTPTSSKNIANIICQIMNQKFYPGIFNVTDNIKLSRYKFACIILKCLTKHNQKYKKFKITPYQDKSSFLDPGALRPLNTALKSKKILNYYKLNRVNFAYNINKVVKSFFVANNY